MEEKKKLKDLYNQLYSENFKYLESLRKKEEKYFKKILFGGNLVVLIIFIIILVYVIKNGLDYEKIIYLIAAIPLVMFIMFVLSTAISVWIGVHLSGKTNKKSKNSKTYKKAFQEKIIAPLVKLALTNSEYSPNNGLSEEEYNKGDWETYDVYESDNKIVTQINNSNLVMSKVHTENISTDSEGHTERFTLFYGIAGYIILPKNIQTYIKITKNNEDLFHKNKDKLYMDMAEFETIFDVETGDKIKAMQIFTSDIMLEIIELVDKHNIKFEFYINQDVLHIRFDTGKIFETNDFEEPTLSYKLLEKNYDILIKINLITDKIYNIIENTEV